VEVHDVARRIVGHYWWLIALLVIVGATVARIVRSGELTYTASARIVLDTPDPSTRAESTAIADTVQAIATSPSEVRAALHTLRLADRDPVDIAEHHVFVRGLGSSAVVTVSVSDPDGRVAARVANALAARVIMTRKAVTSGGVPQEVANLDGRIADLSARIATADAAIDQLNLKIATARSPQSANDLRASRDAASRRRDFLSQQRGVLESERISILGAYALRPKPSIISPASRPLHADPSKGLPYMILGGLLGFVVGVGLAGLLEMFAPTIRGEEALAREFDVPLLGTLRRGLEEHDPHEHLAGIAMRLRLAADAAGVSDVVLLPLPPEADLERLVVTLGASSARGLEPADAAGVRSRARAPRGDVDRLRRASSAVRIRSFNLASPLSFGEPGVTGIAVVSPNALTKREILDLGHLLRVTPMPLLGLICYRPGRVLWHGRSRLAERTVVGATSWFRAGKRSASRLSSYSFSRLPSFGGVLRVVRSLVSSTYRGG
jgi:capsular polysaccharide biosynthesis protein